MLLMLTTDPRPVIGPQAASAQPMSGRDGDEMRRPRRRHQMTPGLDTETAETLHFAVCILHFLNTPSWPPSCQTLQTLDMTAFVAATGELRGESH